MNTFQLRDASEVAFAAYGQFSAIGAPSIDSLEVLNGDDSGFATSQAKRFGTRFSVAIPTFNDVSSPGGSGKTSFDATVFIGRDTSALTGNAKQIYIAMRGTQQKSGEVDDLLGASAKIFSEGAAVEQIIAMYNWYRRIWTKADTAVAQYRVVWIGTNSVPPAGHVLIRSHAANGALLGGEYMVRGPDAWGDRRVGRFAFNRPRSKDYRDRIVAGRSFGDGICNAISKRHRRCHGLRGQVLPFATGTAERTISAATRRALTSAVEAKMPRIRDSHDAQDRTRERIEMERDLAAQEASLTARPMQRWARAGRPMPPRRRKSNEPATSG